ncbi:MAG: RagB/SusD family nutrient uptake outer membrane protein [Bacteroidales bacterium]|nr:RagB/SusD family nutrient uptake outer membrane protein [Bacteroidales bacterium]
MLIFNDMKKIIYILTALALTACVKDLDTLPLNKTEPVVEYVYGTSDEAYLAGLTKLYFQFASNDLTDLQPMDGGASELIRAFWSVQETTTDEAKCSWENDAWVRALNTNTWTDVQNDAVYAVYVRTLQGIAFVNEYLRQTTPERLRDRGVSAELAAKIDVYRAEARFIRAYLYWMALDCFGNVPFTTENSPFGGTYFPQQADRVKVYEFCVSELQDLISPASVLMPPRALYPRADKGSAAGLLARLYINSEVYTGTSRWSEAKALCEDIFTMGYALCPSYADLFRGDNGSNPEALGEFLWVIDYDAGNTESYGGTSYILSASLASTDITDESRPNGQRNGWAGLRVPYEFVSQYYGVSGQNYETGEYESADRRGEVFYIKGRNESMDGALYDFMSGWSCLKFNNIPHDQTNQSYLPVSILKSFSDVDFPMIRLAEIYLIYAEACMNLGQPGQALPYLQQLSVRAGVSAPTEITADFLAAERARELLWEAHRRTDLIRYGLYDTSAYLWPYKGGDTFAGQPFPAYKRLFPIPPTELATNRQLVQNPGY